MKEYLKHLSYATRKTRNGLDNIIEALERTPTPPPPPPPPSNPKTVVTYQNGTVEEYEISGTLENSHIPSIQLAVKIEIGSSVRSIGKNALYRAKLLDEITIPSSITSILASTFSESPMLSHISVDTNNPVYDSRNNCNAIIRTADNVLIRGCINTDDIPEEVKDIGDFAFDGCFNGLSSFTIPTDITSIGNYAFRGTDLTLTSGMANIPSSVINIGQDAFYSCKDISYIEIPDSVTSIGYGAFSDCSNLTSVTIGNNLATIESTLFSGCTRLQTIEIPNSVTSIGSSAFSGCSALYSIIIGSGVTDIEEEVFYGCSNLHEISIPTNVLRIDDYAFGDYSGKVIFEGRRKDEVRSMPDFNWNIEEGKGKIVCTDGTL